MQVKRNQIVIKSTQPMQFDPHKIKPFYFNFTKSVKNLPQIEINEDLPILICPDILHSSQITISKISLFNTLNTNQTLKADIKIYEIYEISEKQASLALSSAHLIKSNLLVANQRIYKIFKPII